MLVTESLKLKELCEHAAMSHFIAIDTEFIRESSYYPNLSLIQIATDREKFAVDMLSQVDFSPLRALLAESSLLKVFHACRQDLEAIYYFFDITFNNVFDTQIAALFLGFHDYTSFESLISHFFSKKIDKSLQFSEWLKRPLDQAQVKYAVDDAALLHSLYSEMKQHLEKLGRYEWAYHESISIVSTQKLVLSPSDILTKFSYHLGNKKESKACYALLEWREEQAKQFNLPRSRILRDDLLLKLSKKRPDTLERFKKVIRNKQLGEETIHTLLEIIHNSEHFIDDEIITKPIKNSYLQKNDFYIFLKTILNLVSREQSIYPGLIASVDDLLLEANGLKSRVQEGWRYEVFGRILDDFRKGKLTIGYKNGDYFLKPTKKQKGALKNASQFP